MTEIVFVRTRYWYRSYTDFWHLVELSGFPTCFVDEVDVSRRATYVVSPMNGEWPPHIINQKDKPRNARFILWNLERPSGKGGVANFAKDCHSFIDGRTIDEVWTMDRRLAQETGTRFVVLGSDYGLGQPGDVSEKKYAFVHRSYIPWRRAHVYGQFASHEIAPNDWDPVVRDASLRQAKFALNIHQDEFPYQEPLRLALFAAYGLPILTETILDSYPWSEEFMIHHPYQGIVGRLREMLGNDYGRWYEFGFRARERMCGEFNFKKVVLEALG